MGEQGERRGPSVEPAADVETTPLGGIRSGATEPGETGSARREPAGAGTRLTHRLKMSIPVFVFYYLLFCVLIIGGAGAVAWWTAGTDLGTGTWELGFVSALRYASSPGWLSVLADGSEHVVHAWPVFGWQISWLVCFLLFCSVSTLCGWVLTQKDKERPRAPFTPIEGCCQPGCKWCYCNHSALLVMLIGSICIGTPASILCIVLSHPLNRLLPLIDNGVVEGIDPISTSTWDGTAWGEVGFLQHSYIDISMGTAIDTADRGLCHCDGGGTGEDCCYWTYTRVCFAPVTRSCGAGAVVRAADCDAGEMPFIFLVLYGVGLGGV